MCFFNFRFRKLQLVPLVLCCSVTNHNQLLYIDLTPFFFLFFFQNCLSPHHIISSVNHWNLIIWWNWGLGKVRNGTNQEKMLAGLYNLNDVTFAELLYFLLSVRVWQSEYFIHSAWCRLSRAWPCWEKSGPARRAVCSLASMFLPPLIAPVTTLSVTSKAARCEGCTAHVISIAVC